MKTNDIEEEERRMQEVEKQSNENIQQLLHGLFPGLKFKKDEDLT